MHIYHTSLEKLCKGIAAPGIKELAPTDGGKYGFKSTTEPCLRRMLELLLQFAEQTCKFTCSSCKVTQCPGKEKEDGKFWHNNERHFSLSDCKRTRLQMVNKY